MIGPIQLIIWNCTSKYFTPWTFGLLTLPFHQKRCIATSTADVGALASSLVSPLRSLWGEFAINTNMKRFGTYTSINFSTGLSSNDNISNGTRSVYILEIGLGSSICLRKVRIRFNSRRNNRRWKGQASGHECKQGVKLHWWGAEGTASR